MLILNNIFSEQIELETLPIEAKALWETAKFTFYFYPSNVFLGKIISRDSIVIITYILLIHSTLMQCDLAFKTLTIINHSAITW